MKRKRLLTLFLAVLLCLPSCSAAEPLPTEAPTPDSTLERSASFSDVSGEAWYAGAVSWCVEKGLMQGVAPERFAPEGTLTRAMMATVLYRAQGEPAVSGTSSFTDVSPGQWYSNAVVWAGDQRIVQGYGNGLFGPEDPVTKEQMEVMLGRYMGKSIPWTGDPALAAPATRGETAGALYRELNKLEETLSGEPSRILVAYFSCTNNTEKIAEHIKAALGEGADLYEILPEEPYTADDLNYNTDCRANREQEDPSARPAIRGTVENLEQYDVVFLGYPIWWGRPPRIVYTFLESYDWTGKTILPFCTSGSSGYSDDGIRDLVGEDTTWLTGRRFSGGATQSAVAEWVESLELPRTEKGEENVFYITVNGHTLTADFADNSSARAFRELLSKDAVTVSMDDYGGFEKVGSLGTTLPRNDSQITTEPGDVILYQGSSITIYYDRNSWSFTRLGKIRDTPQARLKEVLEAGEGTVDVTFSLETA